MVTLAEEMLAMMKPVTSKHHLFEHIPPVYLNYNKHCNMSDFQGYLNGQLLQ
jgi:hypothetical protein